jgi:hypothetical protein
MQLNATICNCVGTILQLMQLYATYATATYATICNYMQLYATIYMQLYATICKYATICNYATCNLCNLSNFMELMQLYFIATLLQLMQLQLMQLMQLMQYATICNYGVAISTLCNYMTDRCGNFNFMQLNATICNCVGTKNVYWHDNLSSCFNECRYHQIGICRIYLPRVMIKI